VIGGFQSKLLVSVFHTSLVETTLKLTAAKCAIVSVVWKFKVHVLSKGAVIEHNRAIKFVHTIVFRVSGA